MGAGAPGEFPGEVEVPGTCLRTPRRVGHGAPRPEQLIIHVLLVDDDARFRAYVNVIIGKESSIGRVTEAADGEAALLLLEESDPQLMLIDVMMPGSGGIAVTRQARIDHPDLTVVVISMHDDTRLVSAALEAGARGYVLKDRLDRELADALAAVIRGETYLSAGLLRE